VAFENIKNVKEFVRTVIAYGFWTYMSSLAVGILD